MELANTVTYVVAGLEEKSRLKQTCCACGTSVQAIETGASALAMARMELPLLIIAQENLPDMTGMELCERVRMEPSLCSTRLMIAATKPPIGERFTPDEWLPINGADDEWLWRITAAIRTACAYNALHHTTNENINLHDQLNNSDRQLIDATAELVEMAAQLHAEIARNAQLEQEHLQMVRRDVIAQAAAALRHEINNPLFAISGSAQNIARRLSSSETEVTDEMRNALRRILTGADRISEVVQTISSMLDPVSTGYVGGLQMLDLRANAGEHLPISER